MSTILQRINQRKREEIAERSALQSFASLRDKAEKMPAARGFQAALEAQVQQDQPGVIAEVKKASPSKGLIRPDFQPASIARSYSKVGAACLSVLTDRDFFQGHEDYLVEARSACQLPVLRKDFTIDEWQVAEARVLGADAILLIVASLEQARLRDLYQLAVQLGLDVLVEVHDQHEMERALKTGSRLIGVNNRDLHSFETHLETTWELLDMVPDDRLLVTESGLNSSADIDAMWARGVRSFLIGETPMRADDPGAELQKLFSGRLPTV